jgi:hypothetical protein
MGLGRWHEDTRAKQFVTAQCVVTNLAQKCYEKTCRETNGIAHVVKTNGVTKFQMWHEQKSGMNKLSDIAKVCHEFCHE